MGPALGGAVHGDWSLGFLPRASPTLRDVFPSMDWSEAHMPRFRSTSISAGARCPSHAFLILKIARVSLLKAECADDTGCVRHDTYEYCPPSSTDLYGRYDAKGRA